MNESLNEFLSNIEHDQRREDAFTALKLIEEASGYKPHLTGSMIGYGTYHYKYDSGHEGDSFVVGFSPRKQHLTIYIMPGFEPYETLMAQLGKYKTGKSCLYIKKLEDIDLTVLQQLVKQSVADMQTKYECKPV